MEKNKFVSEGTMEIMFRANRLFCPRLGRKEVMSPGGLLLWGNYIRVINGFVINKEESLLKLVIANPVKPREPLFEDKEK